MPPILRPQPVVSVASSVATAAVAAARPATGLFIVSRAVEATPPVQPDGGPRAATPARQTSWRAIFGGWLALSAAPLAPGQEEAIELSPFVVSTDRDVGYLAGNTLAGSRLNTALKDTPAAISVLTSEFLSDIGAFDISEALGYAVNVEFDLDDSGSAVPNGISTVGSYQSYRVRGLAASTASNYFRSGIPAETALVERIEDSRGPNSVLFGIASPGGLINSMSKQALIGRAFRKASFSVMSNDSYRATADLNQPVLDGKLAFRLNTVYNRTNSFRHWQYQENRTAHLAATYVWGKKTRIRAEYQRGQIDSNAPRHQNLFNSFLLWDSGGRPTFPTQITSTAFGIARNSTAATAPRVTYVSNNDTTISMRGTMATNGTGPYGDGPITDTRIADYSINIGGPAQDRFSDYDGVSVFLEHQLSRNTFLELAFNHQGHVFERFDPRTDSPQRLKGDPNQNLNGANNVLNGGPANPFAGQLFLDGGWIRYLGDNQSDTGRATVSTERDQGKWGSYRLAAMGEYEKAFSGNSVWQESWADAATGLPAFNAIPENAANRVYRRSYPIERQWATYTLSGPGRNALLRNVHDSVTGRTLSSTWFSLNSNTPGETYTTQQSYMLAGQARYFNRRLIVSAGFRRDEIDTYNVGTMRDPATQEYIVARNDADAVARLYRTNNAGRTTSLGLVYHVRPWLSAFYNRSDNISLPGSATRLPDSGEPGNPIPLESPRGTTDDFGVGLTLFEGRVYARATYYTTRGLDRNATSPPPARDANERIMDALLGEGLITQAEHERRTNVGGQGVFDHAAEGVEVQVTANVSTHWRLQLNYSLTEAVEENIFNEWKNWHQLNLKYLAPFDTNRITTSAARTIAQEIEFYQTTNNGLNQYMLNDGLTKLGNRRHKLSVFTRYGFSSGWLRGLYIGGGYRYQSRIFTGLESQESRREVWGPSTDQLDLMAGYSVRGLGKGRQLSFQINVLNALNERDPVITRYEFVEGRQVPYGVKPPDPLSWRFTTSFEF